MTGVGGSDDGTVVGGGSSVTDVILGDGGGLRDDGDDGVGSDADDDGSGPDEESTVVGEAHCGGGMLVTLDFASIDGIFPLPFLSGRDDLALEEIVRLPRGHLFSLASSPSSSSTSRRFRLDRLAPVFRSG